MKFISNLQYWYQNSQRDFPWRKTKELYNIWVCEVIFQQTKINQGIGYYNRFMVKFPDVKTLAEADEQDVLLVWEGLGYYSRARNIHFSARYIMNELNGNFPKNYKDLLELKGVGKYTAAAIASICFDEKVAAIDGNALRVYARIWNDFVDIADSQAITYFNEIITPYIPNKAGDYNQAIMELGALICTSKSPKCMDCPISNDCLAYKNDTQNILPIKTKKIKVKKEVLNYYYYHSENSILIQKREKNSIWKNMYEFSTKKIESTKYIKHTPILHKLTHKELTIHFYSLELREIKIMELEQKFQMKKISLQEINEVPFPKPFKNFLLEFNKK